MTLPPPKTGYSEPPPRPTAGAAGPVPLRRVRTRSRRRARDHRIDVAIGAVVGVIAVLVVPGIALAAIGAVVVLQLVGLSLLYRRIRARPRVPKPRRGR